MKTEVLKDMVKGVVSTAKEHMVITAITCSVVVGAAGIGGVIAYNHAHADSNVVESETEAVVKDGSYKKLEKRYKAVKPEIGELILDDEMSAKLNADAEEIRAYIENSNTKSVEDDMLEKMKELEENIKKETENSVTKLADKETEVANLVATTNAPKFVETDTENAEETQGEGESTEATAAIVLDDESLTTLDELKKEYFSLKKENKYKSAYDKCGDIINLIQNFAANQSSNGESSDADTNENGDESAANTDSATGTTASADNESGSSVKNNNSGNSGSGSNSGSGNSGSSSNSGTGNSGSSSAAGNGSGSSSGSVSGGNNNSQNTNSSAAQPSAPEAQPAAPQPSNSKAGVAETFYDGSIANGITGDQKAYIDGLVSSWLNGGYTNEGLEDAIADYLFDNGYAVSRVTAVKNSIQLIPESNTPSMPTTGGEIYFYGKCYTNGEMSGDMRVGYYYKVAVY